MPSMVSDVSGVDTTVYSSYDNGDPGNAQHNAANSNSWHRRVTPEMWIWVIVVGAIGGLWAIAGSFRKVLS